MSVYFNIAGKEKNEKTLLAVWGEQSVTLEILL